MLNIRIKRQAAETRRSIARLAEVEASVTGLPDNDLLDFADIFAADAHSALGQMASAEMAKRNLSL